MNFEIVRDYYTFKLSDTGYIINLEEYTTTSTLCVFQMPNITITHINVNEDDLKNKIYYLKFCVISIIQQKNNISKYYRSLENIILIEPNQLSQLSKTTITIYFPETIILNKINYIFTVPKKKLLYVINYNENISNDTTCSICLNLFQNNEIVTKTECQHIFHEKCIMSWIIDKKTCPNCRNNAL